MKDSSATFAKIMFGILGILLAIVSLTEEEEAKCKKVNLWKIGDYAIEEYDCKNKSITRPETFWLFKNDMKISEKGVRGFRNKCRFEFPVNREHHIQADICDWKIQEFRPNKKELIASRIDSAVIYKMLYKTPKRLSNEQIEALVTEWNVAKPNSKQLGGETTMAIYNYEIELYQQGVKRELFTISSVIGEQGDWYYVLKNKRGFFDRMWKTTLQ